MIHDKIFISIQEIAKLKEKLKGIKKDIKHAEKIETDQYLQLKSALKDLKKQVKDYEDEWKKQLCEDDHYNKLREMKLEAEEDIAHENEKLFEQIAKLPPKSVQMKKETEEGFMNIQIEPEMRLYLNGKEEKRRLA